MDDLIHLIYSSEQASALDPKQLRTLLETARRNNRQKNVTGILLHVDSSFFQILEGPAAYIDDLFQRIQRDKRHQKVVQIIREPIAHRCFADWSMGFAAIDLDDERTLAGAWDFFGSPNSLDGIHGGRAKKLLTAFTQGRWRAPLNQERGQVRIPSTV